MAIAILDKIPDAKVGPLRLGAAAKGMLAAGAGDALSLAVLRFAPSIPPVVVKGGAAFGLLWKPVREAIGPEAAELGAIILLYEAIRSQWDGRAKVRNILASFLGKLPSNAIAGAGAGPVTNAQTNNILKMLGG